MNTDLQKIYDLLINPHGPYVVDPPEVLIGKIRKILAKGVDLNASFETWRHDESTLLHEYTQLNRYMDLNVLKFLLQNGADPNRVDSHGQTPFYYALRTVHYLSNGKKGIKPSEIVRVYLENGADISTGKFNEARIVRGLETSPLYTAARAGDVELARLAVENGADVNKELYTEGMFIGDRFYPRRLSPSPLAKAAQIASRWPPADGYLDVVKYLLSRGANPNTITERGKLSIIADLATSAWRHSYAAYPFIEIIKSGLVDVYENRINGLPLIVAARNSMAEKDPSKKLFDDRASWYIIDIEDRRVRERRRHALNAFVKAGAPPSNAAAGGAGAGAGAGSRRGGRRKTRKTRKTRKMRN
jgi:hypothetical protein